MDLARIGHVGAEVAVVGGLAWVLYQQNTALQLRVTAMEKQLASVALHTRNLHQEHEDRLVKLTIELKNLGRKRGTERNAERPPRAREILRATEVEEPDTPPARPRRPRRQALPVQEPSSPVSPTGTVTPVPLEDEESDPEVLLKRESR
jgi:hypothetical protein